MWFCWVFVSIKWIQVGTKMTCNISFPDKLQSKPKNDKQQVTTRWVFRALGRPLSDVGTDSKNRFFNFNTFRIFGSVDSQGELLTKLSVWGVVGG